MLTGTFGGNGYYVSENAPAFLAGGGGGGAYSNNMYIPSVSYTQLDVYKRQEGRLLAIIIICGGRDCSLVHLARVSSKTSGFFL